MKCGAFGHMNIDKRCFLEFNEIMTTVTSGKLSLITCRCPLYGKAHDSDAPLASRDSDKLITEMRQVCSLPMFLGGEDFFSGRDGDEVQHLEPGRLCRGEGDGNGGHRS